MDCASDGKSDRWYKRWITKQSIVQAMDHEAVEGDMNQEAVKGDNDGASDGRSIDGTSDGSRSSRRRFGSGSCRRSGGWCKLYRPYALVVFYSHIHMACRCGQELVA